MAGRTSSRWVCREAGCKFHTDDIDLLEKHEKEKHQEQEETRA